MTALAMFPPTLEAARVATQHSLDVRHMPKASALPGPRSLAADGHVRAPS